MSDFLTCGYNPSSDKLHGPKCEGPADHPVDQHHFSEYDKGLFGVPTKADLDARATRAAAAPTLPELAADHPVA